MYSGTGDFSLGASVTIPAGTSLPTDGSHCVAVNGTEDTLLEGDEAFGSIITGTDQSAVVSIIASDTTTVTITDNDGMCDKRDTHIYVYMYVPYFRFSLLCINPFSRGG